MSGPYSLPPETPAQPTLEGDERFIGVNSKQRRWQLPPGMVSRAENKRMQNGAAEDRAGTRTPVFANSMPATAFTGSGVYSNPNRRELCLVGTATTNFAVRTGTIAEEIPHAVDSSGSVEFAQHFDKLLKHDSDPLVPVQQWDGLSPEGFVLVEPSQALGNGIAIIPNVPWSVNAFGRAIFPTAKGVGFSDISDYTVWDSILHDFPINAGTADALVGAYPYPDSFGLIIGKERSFDLLGPIPGDLGDNWLQSINLANILGVAFSPAGAPPPRMSVISGPEGVGIRARKAGMFVGGGEFHFLSDFGGGGIYRIVPAGNTLVIDPTPISDPIQPLLRRINWQMAGGAVSAMDGIFALWAFPIDGALFNNAIAVFNTVTRQWESAPDLWFSRAHTGRNGRTDPPIPNQLRIDNLLGFDFYGRRRIYALSYAQGKIRLLYEGREDQLARADQTGVEQQTYPIRGLVETRGYATLGVTGNMRRKMNALQFALETLDASAIVTELLAGQNDEAQRKIFTPDRTKYNIQGKAAYQLDNRNDNFLEPKRQDYAIHTGDDFTPGTPVPIEVTQESNLSFSLSRKTRHVSYRVETEGGSCALLATVVESMPAEQEGRDT